MSPTECFLRYLAFLDDQSLDVDLRMSAVVIMSHLDRLCSPYLPPSVSHKVCIVLTREARIELQTVNQKVPRSSFGGIATSILVCPSARLFILFSHISIRCGH